jgi:hypothetical protein
MIKIILFTLSLILFCTSISFSSSGLIILGGLNLSQDNEDLWPQAKVRLQRGYNFNIFYEYNLITFTSFVSGICLDQKGSKSDVLSQVFITKKLLYASIPIYIQFNVNLSNNYLNFYCGPKYNYLLKATAYYRDLESGTEDSWNEMDELKTFDIGFEFGFGYEIKIKNRISLIFRPSLENGYTNIHKDDIRRKNRNLKISTGFKIKI